MYEVEIKAALGDITAEEIEKRAQSRGFIYARTLEENDVYFNGNDRDFMKTDEALRVRSLREWQEGASGDAAGCPSGDACKCMAHDEAEPVAKEAAFITYKGPKLDDVSGTRVEHEIATDDGERASQLLTSLGYKSVFTVGKSRREFVRRDTDGCVTLCIDDVKGLEAYIELEILASDEKE